MRGLAVAGAVSAVVVACGGVEPVAVRPNAVSASASAEPAVGAEFGVVPLPKEDEMIALEGGTYSSSLTRQPVTVSGFFVDAIEVTVAAYERCVKAGACSSEGLAIPPGGPLSGLCNWGALGKREHPINCVTWEQASAYCRHKNKRLPSEEEWEWAARGRARGSVYPWGNELPVSARVCWQPLSKLTGTCRVASFPYGASRERVFDLAGNVWEWTSTAREVDGHTERVLRGGSFEDMNPRRVQASSRYSHNPERVDPTIGFRCAR